MTRVRRDAAVWAVALTAATLMSCQRSAPRPSIVLAVLDTTRADAVSAYGTATRTTPTIDALARSGVLYEHAYANANWTLPSHASLFTGLLVSQHGVRDGNDKLAKFALTMEKVCVDTVEQGFMTKDLALLVGPDQKWLTTEGFLDKVDENLKKAMA